MTESSETSRPRGRQGGRPKKRDEDRLSIQIALRVDDELLARIDTHVDRLKGKFPVASWNRARAMRDLLLLGLEHAEVKN